MRLHQWLYQWQRLGHVASAVQFLGGELRCSRPVGWQSTHLLMSVTRSSRCLRSIFPFHLSPVVLVAPKTGIRSHIDRHRAVVTADAALHTATRVGHLLCLGQNCVLRVKDWCSRVAARFLHCDRQCFPLVRTRTAALVNHRLRSSRPLRAQARDATSTACPARSFAASRSAKLARQSIGRESNTTDLEQALLKSEQPRSRPEQNKLSWQLLRGKAPRQVRRSIEERVR